MLVGALLIQQSRWQQVERSLARLREATALDPRIIAATPEARLAEWIRPSGFKRQKARRLRGLSGWWSQTGGHAGLQSLTTPMLRDALLAQPGIGPETADAVLLYGFDRPVFVIDAYLRRLLARIDPESAPSDDTTLARRCLDACARDAAASRCRHAQIVVHAQQLCRKRPACERCSLKGGCAYAGSSIAASR
ncbi:endonuclease [uncultured Abyssibacter sp.]|uniref:endonuclease III domain-containing protein n=1 Tax=uncultured Abyssibacter sp. TaxID=2320202 RepID=UPI0032B1B0A8